MDIAAPAKVNLYLKVVRKLDDGYHEIETLFERVSIFDRISIEPVNGPTTITCDDPSIPVDETSLLGRTVRLFNDETSRDLNFKVRLEKQIPVSAGLGGGSSDAAALLKGMNELAGFPLEKARLLEISRVLGADVPFFVSGYSFAYGRGRGDILRGVEMRSSRIEHVLINPPLRVSTKEVYGKVSAFGLTKNRGVAKIPSAFSSAETIDDLAKNLCNDLQTIVLREFPLLSRVFSGLRSVGAKGVLLSGSGPTVFGIFEKGEAMTAGEKMKKAFPEKDGWKVYTADTW
ncbi:MAG: 4-(cytidine 5'-diphospho)-2-C-methyl-D-erythritol kinase [Candidatus Omnitrophota bacterium]